MNGKEKVLKTEFWTVGLEDLETIETEIEIYAIKYRTFAKRLQRAMERFNELTEYELEELLYDICEYFRDCTICPLRFNCKFVTDACKEVFNCESCPRLRICLQDGSKGFVQYVRDCKNGGGFE
jgi:hypothetical protein